METNFIFLVAEVNEKVVGTLTFDGGKQSRVIHIGELGISILKEYWGYGIGENLISYLIEWSKENRIIKRIELRVRKDNIRAITLYKKLGFEEECIIRKDIFINGRFYNSLLMALLVD